MRRRSSKPAAPLVPALDAGLRLLSFRAHARSELARKLMRRGYSDEAVQAAMSRLVELGYLDDTAFAEGHVRRRSRSLGPLALGAELAARGVRRDVADRAVAGLSRRAQLEAAIQLVHRQRSRADLGSYQELLGSAGAKLLRRGFSPSIAREACRAVWTGIRDTPD